MIPPELKSPTLNLFADSNQTVNYKRDANNYITQVFGEQLKAINTGFFNVHMSQGIVVQPHWHPHASELVFVISGEAQTSVFDPFTQQVLTYRLKPGQVSVFPQGWFHWIVALTDNTHLLTIFNVPTPDIVYGSDFLRFLPKEVAARAYCVNEEAYAKAVAPIQKSVILGPPPGCDNRSTQPQFSQQTQPSSQTQAAPQAQSFTQGQLHPQAQPFDQGQQGPQPQPFTRAQQDPQGQPFTQAQQQPSQGQPFSQGLSAPQGQYVPQAQHGPYAQPFAQAQQGTPARQGQPYYNALHTNPGTGWG